MKTLDFFKKLTLIMSIILTGVSCVNLKNVRLLQEKSVETPGEGIPSNRGEIYKLNSGDHLYIKVYSTDPKTSKFFNSDLPEYISPTYLYLNSYPVDNDGYIRFSFIDKLYVKGLTIEETTELLQTNLDEYFKEATVFVKLAKFQIAVLGEVGSPGNYTIDKEDYTILQAISLAGGPTTFADIKRVKLIRQTQDGTKIEYLDLTDNGILKSPYYYMMPDDILYLEPRSAKVYAFEKFPYGWVFSLVSFGISLVALTNK
jgi:polysaccharide export outer membrane protein